MCSLCVQISLKGWIFAVSLQPLIYVFQGRGAFCNKGWILSALKGAHTILDLENY
jgi:hypothetical protein